MWFVARTVPEIIVGFCNRWVIEDLPDDKAPAPGHPLPTVFQTSAFERLVCTIHRNLRPWAGLQFGNGRGATNLHLLITQFLEKWPTLNPEQQFDPQGLVAAQRIEVDRLRLPEQAGQLDTVGLLPAQAARVFASGLQRVFPEELVPVPLPRACYMVRPSDELHLCQRLLSVNMITLLPEHEVATRPDGRLLLNGAFAVAHRKGLRAIFDCRPNNAGEERLRWAEMPCGPMLAWLRIKLAEALRGSGDDLSNWFYQLKECPELVPRRAFGGRITADQAAKFGFTGAPAYRMALKVLGMGCLNAADTAQTVHDHILRTGGCLSDGQVLRYSAPLPRARVLEGVYQDDHLVVAVVRASQINEPTGPDCDLIDRSHQAYKAHGGAWSEDKAFGFSRPASAGGARRAEPKFLAWGSSVDGLGGRVPAPIDRNVPRFGA